MKFGKRLASEAARRWRPAYLDYKALKRAIEYDVQRHGEYLTCCYQSARHVSPLRGLLNCEMPHVFSSADLVGQKFNSTLQHELQRVNAFYIQQEQSLEVSLASHFAAAQQYLMTQVLFTCKAQVIGGPSVHNHCLLCRLNLQLSGTARILWARSGLKSQT